MRCRFRAFSLALPVLLCLGCASSRKMAGVREDALAASIRLPQEAAASYRAPACLSDDRKGDTLKVTGLDGREVFIMKAVRDSASGDMVATEQLDAAMVTARFRNVAERNGFVDIEFQVVVPERMADSKWQLRLYPEMDILGERRDLDDLIVTGSAYRKAQLRGYQHYQRFLDRIVSDSLKLIDVRSLEVFIARNIPQLYAFRNDSSYVSDEEFESVYGVSRQQAIEHYTSDYLLWRNRRLGSMREKMWHRYVKSPIVTEGVRLDTVLRGPGGEFIYDYVQRVRTRPSLRKVDVSLSGEIFEGDRRLYIVPQSPPLTFYISSVSTFADTSPRYLTKVISRNVQVDAVSRIAFRTGRSGIDEGMDGNRAEIGSIKARLRRLLEDEAFEVDSIVIVASASPEGRFRSNADLSYRRAESVSEYFSRYVEYVKDSLRREQGLFISVGDDLSESGMKGSSGPRRDIRFLSRSGGENWLELDRLVETDTVLSAAGRKSYFALADVADPDRREAELRKSPDYGHIRERLYPALRTVNFKFCLHRKGMQKDTVHTTVIDSCYMRGVQALLDHDYLTAVELLSPYRDFNTALACLSLDRNAAAYGILEECDRDSRVNYLLALVHSRQGRERDAVECYLRACGQDPSLVHRGNLDPEIAALIRKYDLHEKIDQTNQQSIQ